MASNIPKPDLPAKPRVQSPKPSKMVAEFRKAAAEYNIAVTATPAANTAALKRIGFFTSSTDVKPPRR